MSNDKQQLDRSKEAAKDVGVDTSDDALDNVMGKLDLKRKPDADKEARPEKG